MSGMCDIRSLVLHSLDRFKLSELCNITQQDLVSQIGPLHPLECAMQSQQLLGDSSQAALPLAVNPLVAVSHIPYTRKRCGHHCQSTAHLNFEIYNVMFQS